MDKTDRGKTGLCSHLEASTSIKRCHGLETCDLTVQSLPQARIRICKTLYFYSGIGFKGFRRGFALKGLDSCIPDSNNKIYIYSIYI